ncbi:Hypothetical predicted protein [Paramuricea clavata]|uniref:Uncharacterized protein n=1 Tax=Paramuricea clavata TaxID=317549 RepID=A0A7D9IZ14_PARCT|nr:Hypothetical predicted protein [Paramuricea clavata]
MHYLDYSQTNPKLKLSAPIFKEHDGECKVMELFKFIRDGQEWKGNGSDLFYINGTSKDTKVFEIKSMENLKAWNGSLLILNVSCGNEESEEVHCVLLKLKSLPPYPEVSPTSSSTDVSHSSYQSAPPTEDYTSTREVPFTFPWINATRPTTLTRSSQFTEDQRMSSKLPSQSPTPKTSTIENPQEGFKEETSESDGTNATAIAVTITLLLVALALALGYLLYYRRRKSYPISNPASTEQEYTYAKDTDLARSSVTTKAASEGPTSNGAVYETLEQPGQPTDDNFYNYPDNTNIANQGSSELEYTYAKYTDLPRDTADTKAVRERDIEPATCGGLYHTLEQEGPVSTEQEYSYAKNTDMPSIPLGTEETSNSPPPNSALYHTLEEANPPQAPVYSTLEGPEDVENHN